MQVRIWETCNEKWQMPGSLFVVRVVQLNIVGGCTYRFQYWARSNDQMIFELVCEWTEILWDSVEWADVSTAQVKRISLALFWEFQPSLAGCENWMNSGFHVFREPTWENLFNRWRVQTSLIGLLVISQLEDFCIKFKKAVWTLNNPIHVTLINLWVNSISDLSEMRLWVIV